MGFFSNLKRILWDNDGYYPYPYGSLYEVKPRFNDYTNDADKFNIVLQNPAVLKVFSLQCDLFSLGEIKVYDKTGKELKDDPILARLKNPNPFQSQSQFLWDFMFWEMIGNAYCRQTSKIATAEDMKFYFLEHIKMTWPQELIKRQDKMVLTQSSLNELKRQTIKYRYEDGTTIDIPFSEIICTADLTNGAGNWFKGPDRIRALCKIINNSEKALDANAINLEFSGKFMVAGKQDPADVSKVPMSVTEKEDIEKKIRGPKPVHANKSMIEIRRFVDDMNRLALNDNYLKSYFLIGLEYNIPRDVLEAFVSSTYENQEKVTAKHIAYTLQPKGNDFLQCIAQNIGYTAEGKRICISWDHLPFMQVFMKDKAAVAYQQSQTMTNLLKLGVDLKEINTFLGTNFKTGSYAAPKTNTGQADPGTNTSS